MKYFVALYACICLFFSSSNGQSAKVPQHVNTWYDFWGVNTDSVFQLPRIKTQTRYRDTAMLYFLPTEKNVRWWTGNEDTAAIMAAGQGLYDSADRAQLGQPVGQPTNPARFKRNSEIPLNGDYLRWLDTLNNSVDTNYTALNDTTQDFQHNVYNVPLKFRKQSVTGFIENFIPWNYGVYYPTGYKAGLVRSEDWSFGISGNSSSGGEPMPDNVFGFGYNILNGTARKDTSDGAINFAVESNFLNSLGIVQPNFEVHWPRAYLYNGQEQRVSSYYIGKVNGYTLHEQNITDDQRKSPINGNLYLDISDLSGNGDFGAIKFTGFNPGAYNGFIQFQSATTGKTSSIQSTEGRLSFGQFGNESIQLEPTGNLHLNMSVGGPVYQGSTTIGSDTVMGLTPDPSACVTIWSVFHNQGVVFPKMTTVQKLAIASPEEGLMVYDLTLHKLNYFNGTLWVNL